MCPGRPAYRRPKGRKGGSSRPKFKAADGLSHPKPSRREPRPARSRLDCLKPNPERMINGPAATVARRRRASGVGHSSMVVGKTARCSDRGCEPGSRDEWAT